MLSTNINAWVYYSHSPDEVAELQAAIVPLMEHIRAVANPGERSRLTIILKCETFRSRDAAAVKAMLLRAAKHARAHLGDYFPMLRDDIIRQAEELEEAVKRYWFRFKSQERELIPI
jgi:hypothetical protein